LIQKNDRISGGYAELRHRQTFRVFVQTPSSLTTATSNRDAANDSMRERDPNGQRFQLVVQKPSMKDEASALQQKRAMKFRVEII
jgi:hypothetical protein